MIREFQFEDASVNSSAQYMIEKSTRNDMLLNRLSDQAQQCPLCARELSYNEDSWEVCVESSDILFKALKAGRLRGIVGIFVCNNGASKRYPLYVHLAQELIKRDILVLVSGCISTDMDNAGLMEIDTLESAGEGLKEFCDHLDIAPVLFTPNWSKISRETNLFTTLANLAGEECDKLPMAVIASDWFQHNEAVIGPYDVININTDDPFKSADLIDLHIHHKRLRLDWCDQFHCSIHS